MDNEIKLKTRDWERLLTATQQEKYKNAIAHGYFADYHGREWRHDTFYGAYIWKHPNRVKIIERFKGIIGRNPLWEDITDDNLRDLIETLKDNYSPNSVKTIMAEIKAVIRANGLSKDIPSLGFSSILKGKNVPVQAVYLTDEEIKRIIDYRPRTSLKRYVQKMFVLECLTGARLSDCMNITADNIDDTGRMLVYVAKKTKTEVHVPIHRWLRPFLVSGEHDGEYASGTTIGSYNNALRDICQECGIRKRVRVFMSGKQKVGEKWTFVSSHTGRRSFATNLATKGIPVEQISLLMGHMHGNTPNIEMTQRYIVGKMSIDSNVMKIFGAYDGDESEEDDENEEV